MFGKRIVSLRKSKKMTQEELATALGISRSALSLYEIEKREPDTETLLKIASYFEVSADFLLGVSGEVNSFLPNNQKTEDSPQIGDTNFFYWIEKTGFGYDEIAEKLNISENLLNDYCTGKEEMPLQILMSLSEICEVSTDCLLGIRGKSRPKQDGEFPFRFDSEISRRLKEQAAAMGESDSFLANILGIEETEVCNFFEYGFVPHISVFVKIVEHFLVSSDYLLNRTGSTLTVQEDEDELLRSYRTLNSKSKTMALSRIYELEREESLVAAKDRYLDNEGKSLPSSGTGGGTMVG